MPTVSLLLIAAMPLLLPGAALESPTAAPRPGASAALLPAGNASDAELLVKLREPAGRQGSVATIIAQIAGRTGLRLQYLRPTLLGWQLVQLGGAAQPDVSTAALLLTGDPAVAAALPNEHRQALRAPDDPRLDELWGFALIEAEAAWDLSVGEPGQRVGVVDSGTTRSHRDLQGRIARGWDFISDPAVAQDGDGRDDDDSDDSARETHYHGSHVAGTMLARADDDFGVPGLNWRARLVSARVLGRGGRGTLVDILEAAAWMAGMPIDLVPPIGSDQVSVINLSLGSRGRCSAFERDVYQEILARGVVLVAAAGNEGNHVAVGAPANCPGVIAVGAVDPDAALASYSSFSARIDVMAPGGDDTGSVADLILSIDGGDATGHRWLYGTSMAAPHVAGVVSLMQAVAPDLEPAMIRDILTESPWTCEGCDDEALLQADHAVMLARERQEELDWPLEVAPDDTSDDASDLGAPPAPPASSQSESPTRGEGGCSATPTSVGLWSLVGVWCRRRARYSRISVTTPEPTVRPPSRMAKRS